MTKSFLLMLALIACGQAWAQVESGAPIESMSTPTLRLYENTDIFSESNYVGDYDAGSTQTRLRLSRTLGHPDVRVYAGVQFDQNFAPQTNKNVLMFDDAIAPHAGVMYKPWSFMTTFAEYRHRFRPETRHKPAVNQSDSRIGQSMLTMFRPPSSVLNGEAFEETVWYTRLPVGVLASAWVRGFARKTTETFGNFDIYTEVNATKNGDVAIDKTATWLRAGGRWSRDWKNWKGAVFVYQPWRFTQGVELDGGHDLEGLLVVSGTY